VASPEEAHDQDLDWPQGVGRIRGCHRRSSFSVVSSYRSTTDLVTTTRWVDHTHGVIETLDKILLDMKDIQSGARGYVMTGQEPLLDSFRSGLEDYPVRVRELRGLISDNPSQQHRLDALEPLLTARVHRSQQMVALRVEGKAEEAQGMVASGAGKLMMDKLQGEIDGLQQVEHDLLAERSRKLRGAQAGPSTVTYSCAHSPSSWSEDRPFSSDETSLVEKRR